MSHELTDSQLAEFKDAFDLFDLKRDGKVYLSDLNSLIRSLGRTPPDCDIRTLLENKTVSVRDEQICFVDFLELMTRIFWEKEEHSENEMLNSFAIFDSKNSGLVPIDDFETVLQNLRLADDISWSKIEDFVVEDKSGYKCVHYGDFLKWLKNPLKLHSR